MQIYVIEFKNANITSVKKTLLLNLIFVITSRRSNTFVIGFKVSDAGLHVPL